MREIILKTKAINLLFSIINNITPTHRVTHTYRNEVKSTIKKMAGLKTSWKIMADDHR